jgi:hypothetical protein
MSVVLRLPAHSVVNCREQRSTRVVNRSFDATVSAGQKIVTRPHVYSHATVMFVFQTSSPLLLLPLALGSQPPRTTTTPTGGELWSKFV